MLSLLPFKLGVLAVVIAGIFFAGYHTAKNADVAKAAKVEQQAAVQYQEKADANNKIATQLEDKQTKTRTVIAWRTKQLVTIVQHPIYSNVCLDPDGLSVANAALTRTTPAPTQPDAAVPSTPTTK